jgi:YVTN family beta-propeller protein
MTLGVAVLASLAGSPFASAQGPIPGTQFPPIVYVSNAGGGITEVNSRDNSVIATAPFANNANGVAITPDGTRMYVTNRDLGQVLVFDTRTNVPLATISAGNGSDNLGLAVSPDGELVYVANQASGTVTVIFVPSNRIIQTIPTGAEPIWVTFSANGSRAYVSNQASGTLSVIATASGTVIATIGGFSCPFESKLTLDGTTLLVSSQCDNSLKVVSLASNAIVNSIPTGPNPRGIALTPDGKRAYVADWFSNTVDVIDLGAQQNLNTPIVVGSNPWGMAMTPEGKAYTANFGDGTISVIDTNTNLVTATLRARSNPEDVAVSTTAKPRILDYAFEAFDPPGSTDTVPRGLNNRGQSVGSFQDGAGVVHGYLRQPNGSFVTIDPPNSTLSVATSVNDFGTVVGEWLDTGGAAHGFVRSAAGVYTTLDFPGASDSGATDVNDAGEIVGAYDLGDQTTNIAFVFAHGQFTSFEDPAAVPAQTAASGVNLLGFVSGIFGDAAENLHGFVRTPTGYFNNYDFPGADNTIAAKINNLGQVAGQYFTNFPSHGYVLMRAAMPNSGFSPGQFFSVDYPNSQATALRGINGSGQITGFYRLPGSTARHGFLAKATKNEE